MGQARDRGSKEQREIEGVAKRAAADRARAEAALARERAMTPADRASRVRAQTILATLLGVTAGFDPFSAPTGRKQASLGTESEVIILHNTQNQPDALRIQSLLKQQPGITLIAE